MFIIIYYYALRSCFTHYKVQINHKWRVKNLLGRARGGHPAISDRELFLASQPNPIILNIFRVGACPLGPRPVAYESKT